MRHVRSLAALLCALPVLLGTAPRPFPVRDAGLFIGRVVDYDTGAPLAGVPVAVGTVLLTGDRLPARVPPGVEATATGADGTFTVPLRARAGRTYVEIFPEDGHLSLHTLVPPGATERTYRVSRPTREELEWLRQLNADRIANGVPGDLIIDEYAEETARYRARSMARSGVFKHGDAFSYYERVGGIFPSPRGRGAENIGAASAPSSWRQIERAFMSEKCNIDHSCAQTRVADGETGHYQAIVDARARWAGIAQVPDGKSLWPDSAKTDYYAQVFVGGS